LSVAAASAIAPNTGPTAELAGFCSTAMRRIFGIRSRSTSSRLAANSAAKNVEPVTLPSGSRRLLVKPASTASPALAMTTGIALLACFAARVPGVPWVTITSTLATASSRPQPPASFGARSLDHPIGAHQNDLTKSVNSPGDHRQLRRRRGRVKHGRYSISRVHTPLTPAYRP